MYSNITLISNTTTDYISTTRHWKVCVLFYKTAYFDLVDSTGRAIRKDRRDAMPQHLPPIVERLGLKENLWLEQATAFEKLYHKKIKRHKTFNTA